MIELVNELPTRKKYIIDDRYYVYLFHTSCQNCVIDTKTSEDITFTEKGTLLIIEAYNFKNKRW